MQSFAASLEVLVGVERWGLVISPGLLLTGPLLKAAILSHKFSKETNKSSNIPN